MNRSIQVEGAFGVLKKVKLEILLLCMGYNFNKLHKRIDRQADKGKKMFTVKLLIFLLRGESQNVINSTIEYSYPFSEPSSALKILEPCCIGITPSIRHWSRP